MLLGAHKPLWLEGRLGGTVTEVVSNSRRPVAVLLDRGLTRVKRVLVAYAGGPEDRAALEFARRLGRAPGVELTMLHVVSPGQGLEPGQGRAQVAELLSSDLTPSAGLSARAMQLKVVEHESPAEAVLDEARAGYDLIVLGMNTRWVDDRAISLRRRRVMKESPVSILVVHPPPTEAAALADAASLTPALGEGS